MSQTITRHKPTTMHEVRALHPLTETRTNAGRSYTFTAYGLPLGEPVLKRRLSYATRSTGPEQDPYTVHAHTVRITFPDLTWCQYTLEYDSLTDEMMCLVRTSDEPTPVSAVPGMAVVLAMMIGQSRNDFIRQVFEEVTQVRISQFMKYMHRSVR